MTRTPRSDVQRIADILDHLGSIQSVMRRGKQAFLDDPVAQKAVAYDLMVIGEAASRISRRTQRANPKVPWRKLGEYRNDLIHEYATMDLSETWAFYRDSLPGIDGQLRRARVPPSDDATIILRDE